MSQRKLELTCSDASLGPMKNPNDTSRYQPTPDQAQRGHNACVLPSCNFKHVSCFPQVMNYYALNN